METAAKKGARTHAMDTLSRLLGRTVLFDEFCAPARGRAALWRLAGGLATAILLIVAMTVAGFWLWRRVVGGPIDFDSPIGVLLIFATFLAWPPAIAVAVRVWHRRPVRSLLGRSGRIAFRPYLRGVLIAIAISLAMIAVGAALVGVPARAPQGPGWPLLAALALGLLVIQTGSEELLFRGYLQQQLGARFRSGLWWAVLPSLLFGALHWEPDGFGDGAASLILTTGVFGLCMAVIVARTGDLSLVMGLHLGVNISALLLVAPSEHLSGLALLQWPDDPATLRVLVRVDFVVICLAGLAALFWDSRRRKRHRPRRTA